MRVLRAFFQEDRDIGQTEVLVDIAADVGLNAEKAEEVLASGMNRNRHQEALRHAREDMLIRVVPTIVVGDQVFRGTPSLEVLKRAIDDL